MRELEHPPQTRSAHPTADLGPVVIRGAGRLGTVLAAAFREAGLAVEGPLRREAQAETSAGVVLLCVPDREISAAAAAVPEGPLVGHCSGATGLDVLGTHRGFSLHPLMTVPSGASAALLRGAPAAVDGSDPEALAVADRLARAAGLEPVQVAAQDRVAYHAAASVAANFLIPVEALAERLAATAGLQRAQLVPLVRAAVENWARLGAEQALTGPVARGDEETVARQRTVVAQRTPELLALFDALTEATRHLAGRETLSC
jgi:predicted short-subunit dehydrogenase-like oxidoreductase (DUF2520 family)